MSQKQITNNKVVLVDYGEVMGGSKYLSVDEVEFDGGCGLEVYGVDPVDSTKRMYLFTVSGSEVSGDNDLKIMWERLQTVLKAVEQTAKLAYEFQKMVCN